MFFLTVDPTTLALERGLGSDCGSMGVDAHGLRRSVGVMKKRLEKATQKARVITRLAQANRQARILARTGHRPVVWALEGQRVSSIHPSGTESPSGWDEHLQIRWRMLHGCHQVGVHGERRPHVAARKQVLQEWIRLWDVMQPQRRAVERAWEKLRGSLSSARSPWGRTKGPISAVICALMDLQWTPVAPNQWRDPDGVTFNLEEDDTDQLLDFELQGSLDQTVWEQASRHHLGAGLWQGAGLTVVRRHLRRLRRQERHGEAAMLVMVATGSLWPAGRRFGAEAGRHSEKAD